MKEVRSIVITGYGTNCEEGMALPFLEMRCSIFETICYSNPSPRPLPSG